MEWGEVLEGYPGDALKLLSAASPGTSHMPFVDFWLKICAQAMDFPYEFLSLDFSRADWSRMRGILLMINHALRPWQSWISESMQGWWDWRIRLETMPGGDLFPAPEDWDHVEWQGPEEVWLDRQETAQADAIEWQMGLGTMARAVKRRGHGDLNDSLEAKAEEIMLARKIEDKHGLPHGTLLHVEIPGQHPAEELIEEEKTEHANNDGEGVAKWL
jgi:capsid protein